MKLEDLKLEHYAILGKTIYKNIGNTYTRYLVKGISIHSKEVFIIVDSTKRNVIGEEVAKTINAELIFNSSASGVWTLEKPEGREVRREIISQTNNTYYKKGKEENAVSHPSSFVTTSCGFGNGCY